MLITISCARYFYNLKLKISGHQLFVILIILYFFLLTHSNHQLNKSTSNIEDKILEDINSREVDIIMNKLKTLYVKLEKNSIYMKTYF